MTGNRDPLLASLPVPWREGLLEPLGLGLTNCNYRLRLPSGRSYFLRQGHSDPVRLGIEAPGLMANAICWSHMALSFR